MDQATQSPTATATDLVTKYEDIPDEFTKFKAQVSPTDVEGVKLLKLDAIFPFRTSQELADWLYGCVNRLEDDLSDKGM